MWLLLNKPGNQYKIAIIRLFWVGLVFPDRVLLCSSGCPWTQLVDQVASNSKRSSCLCLPSAGTKDVVHHHMTLNKSCLKSVISVCSPRVGYWYHLHFTNEGKDLRSCNILTFQCSSVASNYVIWLWFTPDFCQITLNFLLIMAFLCYPPACCPWTIFAFPC